MSSPPPPPIVDENIQNNKQSPKLLTIDFSLLTKSTPQTRSLVLHDIRQACLNLGCFHIVNHGVSERVIEEAIDVNYRFFQLPMADKQHLLSDEVLRPVRYTAIAGKGSDGSQFTRDFLKLCAHPIEHFLSSWPTNPPLYRDKMGMYTKELRRVGIEIFVAIMESLNLEPTFLRDKVENGMHIMGVNCYQPCNNSQSNLKMGAPPHSDHSIITLLLQTSPGLEVMDPITGTWYDGPKLKGSLQVLVGDHLEVLSNGIYKSVLHRALPDQVGTRVSIVSWHNFAMDEVVEPSKKLVDEEHPKGYKASNLMDFFKHVSSKQEKTFIDSLKI